MMRAAVVGAALVAALGTAAPLRAQPRAARYGADAAQLGARRSDGLLGRRRQRGLAASHGDSAQRRFRELAAERRRAARRQRMGSRGRQRGRLAVQGVRRRRPHASTGPPAHHVGRRRHAANRFRRRARRRGCSSSRPVRSGLRASRRGKDSRAPNGSGRPAVTRIPCVRRSATAAGPIAPGGGGRGQRGGPPPSGSLTEGGSLKVDHDRIPRGVSAQERRAVQRERHDHRVLPSPARGLERRLVARADDRRGSALSQRSVLDEHALQARSRTAASGIPRSAARRRRRHPQHPRPFRMFAAKRHPLLVPFDGSFDIRKARTQPGQAQR